MGGCLRGRDFVRVEGWFGLLLLFLGLYICESLLA
jgi:hypothetical protein